MIEKWQELLKQQEIYGDIFDFSSESELLEFEARTGIILPTGYKEYCLIFGSGGFGNDLLNISTVNNEVSWTLDDMTNEMRENMNLEAYCGDVITAEKLENLREILKSALLFGGNGKGQFSLWDLRTNNITDDSYDIYLASYHSYDCCKVGRDFYTFVREFCLGEKSYDYLPRDLQPDDTSVFFGIGTSRAYTYFQESLVDGVIDKSTLRPENYHDQCDFHIRTALDAGMNAKDMSERWRVPIETIQQLIAKVLTVN